MYGASRAAILRRVALALSATAIAGALLGTALDAAPTSDGGARAAPGHCGTASAATIASVDDAVAQGIYEGELRSREVSADDAHVTGSLALLNALEGDDAAAVYSAVHAIVYTPHWHIVRLRVLKAGHVIADVGGPDVIAPVSGVLRHDGKVVGSYVMSVQDDLGYEKLVTRLIGVPIDLYRSGSLLMGTLQPAPPQLSEGSTVSVSGVSYRIQLLSAKAFPSGTLRIALAIPTPARSVTTASCSAVRLAAWGSVAIHIAAQLQPLQDHYQALVNVLHGTTGGPAYISSGSKRIAGGSVPKRIPSQGTVRFDGRSWAVFSWEPLPRIRVYFLTPPA
ncbi:MAG: hypothetical protein ACRDJX_11360 [Solirubrobacteraceae bacterium]